MLPICARSQFPWRQESCDTTEPKTANPAIALDDTALLLKKKAGNRANEGSLSAVAIADPEGLTL